MKVSSERIEGCMVTLTIEVEPDEMKRAQDGAYKRLVKQVEVPGFRKGKAPRALLERHIGKESLDAEALEQLVPELYSRAIQEEDIEAIGQPDVEMTQTDPPIFKATVPVRPVVELGDYHSIKVSSEPIEITEENVEQGLENLRRMQATFEPVEREAAVNDLVTIDVEGTVGDESVLDSKGSQYRIVEDSVMPVPGFAEQLQGMKAGDEKEFTLPFPEDHESEELAGKDCLFKVSMTDVKEEHLPEIDDEFAKSLGQEIETVEQLRERLEENIRAAAERDTRSKLENDVIESVASMATIEFPSIFTDQEIDRLAGEQMMRLGGMQLEDFLRYRGVTEEDFRNELRPAAEKRVISSLVLNKVFENETIEVEDAAVDAEIERIVEEAAEQGEMARTMFSNPDARENIRGRLLTEKTLNFLIDIATAEDKITPEENANEEPLADETPTEQSADEEENA